MKNGKNAPASVRKTIQRYMYPRIACRTIVTNGLKGMRGKVEYYT